MRRSTLTDADRDLRKAAYRAVRLALKAGILVRPESCDNCHRGKPDAHHHQGYEPEHQLDVLWLCDMCHATLHASGRCPRPIPPHIREALQDMLRASVVVAEWEATA